MRESAAMKVFRETHPETTKYQPESPTPSGGSMGRGRWSTAFLMAGSAILGATAVAFWNRRTIANMRIQFLADSEQPQAPSRADEEIL